MMTIYAVSPESAPLSLMALADPSAERVAGYLRGDGVNVFVGEEGGAIIAVAVVVARRRADEVDVELANIAVEETRRGHGIGRRMLEHVVDFAAKSGARCVMVGTGNSSLGQLAFYQKSGFRIAGVETDFFRDDDPPIFEAGIRCLDRVRLTFQIGKRGVPTERGSTGRGTMDGAVSGEKL